VHLAGAVDDDSAAANDNDNNDENDNQNDSNRSSDYNTSRATAYDRPATHVSAHNCGSGVRLFSDYE
jgi:hypothetical protein